MECKPFLGSLSKLLLEPVFLNEGYNINKWHLQDVNFEQFQDTISRVVALLQIGPYDRFFFFILSHGNENGIRLCLQDGETIEPNTEIIVKNMLTSFDNKNLVLSFYDFS